MSQNDVSSSPQSQSQTRQGVALITGASQGIGRGIALRLADDGYDIAANCQTSTVKLNEVIKEIEEKGRRALAIQGDVSNEKVVIDMIDCTVRTLGSLDVMVANAGIGMFQPFVDTTVDAFDRQMAVNARGTMLCYKYAAIQMIAQKKRGRIIGACSLAGKQAIDNLFGYSATKFAIRGMTQSAARALGEHDITVNAYASGGVSTRLLGEYDKFVSELTKSKGATGSKKATGSEGVIGSEGVTGSEEDTRSEGVTESKGVTASEEFLKKVAVNRMGTPEDIAHLVSYLVSKEAGFITGQTITIDGGVYFD